MKSVNPLAPRKYRISYGDRVWYADVVDFNPASGVLTMDGLTTMIYHPEQLNIVIADSVQF